MYFEEALMLARQGIRVSKRDWDRDKIDYLYYGDSEDGSDDRISFYMRVKEGEVWKHFRLETIASSLKVSGYFDEWYITNMDIDENLFDFQRIRDDIARIVKKELELNKTRKKMVDIEKAMNQLLAKLDKYRDSKR